MARRKTPPPKPPSDPPQPPGENPDEPKSSTDPPAPTPEKPDEDEPKPLSRTFFGMDPRPFLEAMTRGGEEEFHRRTCEGQDPLPLPEEMTLGLLGAIRRHIEDMLKNGVSLGDIRIVR